MSADVITLARRPDLAGAERDAHGRWPDADAWWITWDGLAVSGEHAERGDVERQAELLARTKSRLSDDPTALTDLRAYCVAEPDWLWAEVAWSSWPVGTEQVDVAARKSWMSEASALIAERFTSKGA